MDSETFFKKLCENTLREEIAVYYFMESSGSEDKLYSTLKLVHDRDKVPLGKDAVKRELSNLVKMGLLKKTGNIYSLVKGFKKDIKIDMMLKKLDSIR